MNIYKTSPGTYSLDLKVPKDLTDHIKCVFYKGGKAHRTDGPAIVTWKEFKRGSTQFYYIRGQQVPKESFLKVLHANIEDLPLYINDPILKDIAIDRLKGVRSGIELTHHKEYDIEIKVRTRVLSLKQLGILRLTQTIQRMVRLNIQHLKPFQVLS